MHHETKAKLTHGGWGAVLGALVAMIIGFSWGGWVTGGTATKMSDAAVVASRSAICVAQFMKAPDREDQLKAFRELNSYKRSDFVRKGGWDKMPGEDSARGVVNRACADGIEELLKR